MKSILMTMVMAAASQLMVSPEAEVPGSGTAGKVMKARVEKMLNKHGSATVFQRSEAARILLEAADNKDACLDVLSTAISKATDRLGENSFQASRLEKMLRNPAIDTTTEEGMTTLREGMKTVMGDLMFQPTLEAPLAEGWPDMTPVGELVLYEFPVYRMARTDMDSRRGSGDTTAFFKLFSHIKSNDVPMTAPVQVDFDVSDDKTGRGSMAFLYESTKQGETGKDGAVEVVDIPKTLAISIGYRGYERSGNMEEAQERFAAWLKKNEADFEAAGSLRVMGWNSPYVPASRRFYEIQQPVRLKEQTSDASAKKSLAAG